MTGMARDARLAGPGTIGATVDGPVAGAGRAKRGGRAGENASEPMPMDCEDLVWPNAEASGFVRSGGVRWHVQRLGTGPSMLLIHGTGASLHSWEGLVAELRSSFALTLVDLPGHGASEPVPPVEMSLEAMARALGILLTEMAVVPEIVVGHSAGAAIAARMGLDGRLEPAPAVIVSINGALLPWRGVARWLFPPLARALAARAPLAGLLARHASRPGSVERMLTGTGRPPPPRSVAFYEQLLRKPSRVQAALDMMAMWNLEELERALPGLTVPLELIACGEDTAVPADTAFAVRSLAPNACVRYLRGLGHLAHEENPAEIAEIVRAAWRRHGDPRHAPGSADLRGTSR